MCRFSKDSVRPSPGAFGTLSTRDTVSFKVVDNENTRTQQKNPLVAVDVEKARGAGLVSSDEKSRQQSHVHMSIRMSIHMSAHMSIHSHQRVWCGVHMSIHMPLYMATSISIHMSIHRPIHMSARTPV